MTVSKTSVTHPIRLDFVNKAGLGVPGRLGMTFAPGKKGPGLHGLWDRDLDVDLTRLRQEYAVDTLVCLVEDHELQTLHIADLPTRAMAYGLSFLGFPIVDASIPDDDRGFGVIIADVITRLRAGETVAVHCKGGLGRTGLAVACCLVVLGVNPESALQKVRQARPGTVETRQQEDFVRSFLVNRC